MTLRFDIIWNENGSLNYRASCSLCAFATGYLSDEDDINTACLAHVCAPDDAELGPRPS